MKVHHGAYTFTLEPDAPIVSGKATFALVDSLPKNLNKDGLRDLKRLVDQNAEGVWVQSRLMAVFGLTAPEETATTPSVVEISLRAAADGGDEEDGITFSCLAGNDGRTCVYFNDKTRKKEAKRITRAFWKVLLAEPGELDDYAGQTVDRSGAKVAYGVRDGRCFFGDHPDDEDIDIPSIAAVGCRVGKSAFDDFDPVGMVGEDDEWVGGDDWDDDEKSDAAYSILGGDDDDDRF